MKTCLFFIILCLQINPASAIETDKETHKFAFAVNPASILGLFAYDNSDDGYVILSGSISYLNHQNHSETVIPIVLSKESSILDPKHDDIAHYIDLEYRKYSTRTLTGKYVDLFLRLGKTQRYEKVNYLSPNTYRTNHFTGIGIGFGQKYLLSRKSRIYGSFAIKIGAYTSENIKDEIVNDSSITPNDGFTFDHIDIGKNYFLDIEFLRFSKTF